MDQINGEHKPIGPTVKPIRLLSEQWFGLLQIYTGGTVVVISYHFLFKSVEWKYMHTIIV